MGAAVLGGFGRGDGELLQEVANFRLDERQRERNRVRVMRNSTATLSLSSVLGIECGATRSVALWVQGTEVRRAEGGPANLKLLNDEQLVIHLRKLRDAVTGGQTPAAIAIGMAGARMAGDHARIIAAAGQVWPGVPCRASNDLETGLAAADELSVGGGKGSKATPAARVLVLSGTGSCCFGRNAGGAVARCGGWGHLLGDQGSGYDISLRALKAVVELEDHEQKLPPVGRRILRLLLLNDAEALVGWAQGATKTEIAALAVEVFAAAQERDAVARRVLREAAASLAEDALACAARLSPRGSLVQFVLAGSVLVKQPAFARQVKRLIQQRWSGAVVEPLRREGAWGAVELARKLLKAGSEPGLEIRTRRELAQPRQTTEGLESLKQSPTEQRNPRSMKLDKLSLGAAIELMLSEDAKIPRALLLERRSIEQALRCIVRSFRQGGRLFYVGAGTSGRLGVLDASECPPTFRTSPEMVQGIMAGGQVALWNSVEGAEDDSQAGATAMQARGITQRDVVVGIAASGRTPFVWGALGEARKRRARTVLLCFNSFLNIPSSQRPNVVIAPNVGPEILTGSTRLKAGTATKLVLNIFTTLAMVQMGKVEGNLMVDVNPSNVKLRDRAVRIVRELTGADAVQATAALEKTGWIVKRALELLRPC